MKSPYRKKKMIVAYKGWHLYQVPWSAYGKTRYAKWWINAQGKECIHSGYGKFVPRKKLRLMLKYHVDHLNEWNEMMQKIHENKKPLSIRMGETE